MLEPLTLCPIVAERISTSLSLKKVIYKVTRRVKKSETLRIARKTELNEMFPTEKMRATIGITEMRRTRFELEPRSHDLRHHCAVTQLTLGFSLVKCGEGLRRLDLGPMTSADARAKRSN